MEGRSSFDLDPPDEQVDALSPLKRDHHGRPRTNSHVSEVHHGRSRTNSHVSEVHYEDELEKYNSNLQVAWSKVLDKSELPGSNTYKSVQVLLLSWEQDFDDLHVHDEVTDLATVFEDEFHYNVTRMCLNRIDKRKTQAQVNLIVAQWVFDFDAPNTLLILYFAGHGRPGPNPGSLEITGQRIASDFRAPLDRVIWNKTEEALTDTWADVLQIFDCCHAGTVATRDSRLTASEFLAATKDGHTTPKPGPRSFTRALIWALRQLVETEGRFTTSHLTNMIRAAPDFPKEQVPMLLNRNENGQQSIILQPLSRGGPPGSSTPAPKSPVAEEKTRQDVLTLKFIFDLRPTAGDISNLGIGLWNIIHGNRLNVSQVTLVGVQPKDNDGLYRAVKRLRSINRRPSTEGSVSIARSPIWSPRQDREPRAALEVTTSHPDGNGEDADIVLTPTTIVYPPAEDGEPLHMVDGFLAVHDRRQLGGMPPAPHSA